MEALLVGTTPSSMAGIEAVPFMSTFIIRHLSLRHLSWNSPSTPFRPKDLPDLFSFIERGGHWGTLRQAPDYNSIFPGLSLYEPEIWCIWKFLLSEVPGHLFHASTGGITGLLPRTIGHLPSRRNPRGTSAVPWISGFLGWCFHAGLICRYVFLVKVVALGGVYIKKLNSAEAILSMTRSRFRVICGSGPSDTGTANDPAVDPYSTPPHPIPTSRVPEVLKDHHRNHPTEQQMNR
ncbi:hypothetical protein DL93DRAFT_2101177 [Clavulina sp. PMI_390]|nr:hypothetical protein DL93DRAFT_2101177 [Clavulina sp. PMI_390]